MFLKCSGAYQFVHRDSAGPEDSDLQHEIRNCIRISEENFQNKEKHDKIQINGQTLSFDGFSKFEPKDYVSLNISFTNQRLPFNGTEFTNLLMLHATDCGLSKIDEIGTELFPSLKVLNLSRNHISSMKSYDLNNMKVRV